MAIFKCKMCGGSLKIVEATSVCECEHCGATQTLPRLDSDKKENLYDRANHFRRNNDYDKAMGIYEQILNEDKTDAEAYWSLVLCRYGIEYVEDPSSHKRIPTVNRAQYTSIYADENYKAAIQYADSFQKNVYEEEAKVIDGIQKGILEISAKEEPFDVFICYKETDENGRRTKDSVLANDLYHQLNQEGFKVFFSRITLEDKLGQEYEPFIFAALNSSKVMVALGTKPEYFKAVWVKNEWSRYISLIKSGAKKMLIPAYKDMDPYDLPEEFSHLQAQDMNKLGFMQDLIRGIKKILEADKPKEKETVVIQASNNSNNVSALLKRGAIALEDSEWQKADDFFEEVLNQDPECGDAYWGKLLSKNRAKNIQELSTFYLAKKFDIEVDNNAYIVPQKEHIDEIAEKYYVPECFTKEEIIKKYNYDLHYTSEVEETNQKRELCLSTIKKEKLYIRAKQYAGDELNKTITSFIEGVDKQLTDAILASERNAKSNKDAVSDEYNAFISRVDEEIKELYSNALDEREKLYISRKNLLNSVNNLHDCNKIKNQFIAMEGYKDTAELIDKCDEKCKELQEEDARRNQALKEQEAKNAERIKELKIQYDKEITPILRTKDSVVAQCQEAKLKYTKASYSPKGPIIKLCIVVGIIMLFEFPVMLMEKDSSFIWLFVITAAVLIIPIIIHCVNNAKYKKLYNDYTVLVNQLNAIEQLPNFETYCKNNNVYIEGLFK